MEQKNIKETPSGYNYETMPESMFMEEAEKQLRDRVERKAEALKNEVQRIRGAGVVIKSANDLKRMTPDYIRQQIAATKKKRIQDTVFLPASIRRHEEKEFAQMEAQLIPIATSLQESIKSIPFTIHIDNNGEDVYFNGKEVEKYIVEKSTVSIPEYVRAYYDELQKVCEAWANLLKWTASNGIVQPDMQMIRDMTRENLYADAANKYSKNMPCEFALTPELMFQWYKFGHIRTNTPPATETGENDKAERQETESLENGETE